MILLKTATGKIPLSALTMLALLAILVVIGMACDDDTENRGSKVNVTSPTVTTDQDDNPTDQDDNPADEEVEESGLTDSTYPDFFDETGNLNVPGNLKVTGDIAGAIGRTTTLMVAASDSYGPSKTQADYVCDGIDDHIEINAALNSLGDTGGRVMLSEGNFTLGDSIVFPDCRGVCLEGQMKYGNIKTDIAEGGTAIQSVLGGKFPLVVINQPNSVYVTIRNLAIDGANSASGTDRHCIYATSYSDMFFDDLYIHTARGSGIYIEGAHHNIWIKDSWIEGNYQYNLYVEDVYQLWITDNYFFNSQLQPNIYLEDCRDLRFTSNMVLKARNHNMQLNGVSGMTIVGNEFKNASHDNVNIYDHIYIEDGTSACSDIIVASNIFTDDHDAHTPRYSVNLTGATDAVLVHGNISRNSVTGGFNDQSSGTNIIMDNITN